MPVSTHSHMQSVHTHTHTLHFKSQVLSFEWTVKGQEQLTPGTWYYISCACWHTPKQVSLNAPVCMYGFLHQTRLVPLLAYQPTNWPQGRHSCICFPSKPQKHASGLPTGPPTGHKGDTVASFSCFPSKPQKHASGLNGARTRTNPILSEQTPTDLTRAITSTASVTNSHLHEWEEGCRTHLEGKEVGVHWLAACQKLSSGSLLKEWVVLRLIHMLVTSVLIETTLYCPPMWWEVEVFFFRHYTSTFSSPIQYCS